MLSTNRLLAGAFVLVALCAPFLADEAKARETPPLTPQTVEYGRVGLPFHFEPSAGRSADGVRFVARGPSYSVFIGPSGMTIVIPVSDREAAASPWEALLSRARGRQHAATPSLVRIGFIGASRTASFEPADRLGARVNYFLGNDPKRWLTNVPIYRRLNVREVWPGIDLSFYEQGSQLELDFALAPGADANRIRLGVEGLAGTKSDSRGNLAIATAAGRMRLMRPHVFQNVEGRRHEVQARYVFSQATLPGVRHRNGGNRVDIGIKLAAYDKSVPLVIDPRLKYSTLFGGSGSDKGLAVATDSSGNVYVAGTATSANLPLRNPADPRCSACSVKASDGFVAKFNPKRSGADSLVYATYIGGSGNSTKHTGDSVSGVAVDSAGNIYVAGTTTSSDFPTTSNALQTSCPTSPAVSPCNTGFVTELNPLAAGSAQLVYSTYLGGSGNATSTPATGDGVTAIGLITPDLRPGDVFVTGFASSTDFPLTQNALQTDCGAADAGSFGTFIAELNTGFAGPDSLSYSTYVCGGTTDLPDAIYVAGGRHVFVAGGTESSDFPTTTDAFQSSCNACPSAPNAFVAEILPALDPSIQLVYATFFGGSGSTLADGSSIGDVATSVAAPGLSIYLAGTTSSPDLPSLTPPDISSNGFQQKCPSKNLKLRDGTLICKSGFVAQLVRLIGPGQTLLSYGSYLGGSGVRRGLAGDSVSGIAVDSFNDIYVTGTASSRDFPTTRDALKRGCGSCRASAFVAKLSPAVVALGARSSLAYSTLLGGSSHDEGNALTVDGKGNAYVAGTARSGDFPTTGNAFASAASRGADAFVSVIATAPSVFPAPRVLDFGTAAMFGGRFETIGPRAVVFNAHANQVPVRLVSITQSDQSNFRVVVNGCGDGILPGSSCPVFVSFNPVDPGKHDEHTASLTMLNNTSAGETVVRLLGKTARGRVSIGPPSLSFPPQKRGIPSSAQFVTITNHHGIAMGIIGIAVTGKDKSDFSVSGSNCNAIAGNLRGVDARSSCKIAVTFRPSASGGRSASLTLTDEAADGKPPGTQTIALTGVGK